MNRLPRLAVIIVVAIAICPVARAQSYDQPAIPDAVEQGLYGRDTNRDDKLRDAMFGSNGETYQTHVNAASNPTGTETEAPGAAFIGTTNAKCETAENDISCH